MPITDDYIRVPLSQIKIDRENRQRKNITVDDLLVSIKTHGVINPIIIDKSYNLIAGERRFTASQTLGLTDIPCRFLSALNPLETQLIELEENLKRKDLDWRDQVSAIAHIHELYSDLNESWSMERTADSIGMGRPGISRMLTVYRELQNPKLSHAPNMDAAYNIIMRQNERASADALSDILSETKKVFKESPVINLPSNHVPLGPLPAERSIIHASFLDWVKTYNGPKFNFIHCDFPYGIGFNGGDGTKFSGGQQSGRLTQETYHDGPEVYWQLLRVLCENLDKIMSHSAHLMFWFSMEHYTPTMEFFRVHAPTIDFSAFPLIWHKSDNVGVLPDPKRGPRRVYETALVGSRGDRYIAKAISNAYSAPTDKLWHTSTKTEPVLRHFFQMFVDENTKLLDPTCGSGSALRAAESLGASPENLLGLEISKESHENATKALKKFRLLRGKK